MVEPPALPRRRLLAATVALAGATGVAGCGALWDQTGATDVVAYNVAGEPKVVSVTITPAGANAPHTSRTLEMAPGERVDPVNDGKLPTNSSYAVAVDVADGPSETFQWTDPDVERAPLYVLVDGSRNVRFLLEAG